MIRKLTITHGWTLFLDRDGVINQRIENDYVKHSDEFHFVTGVLDAMKIFAKAFDTIIVVTNQQGIGRGLMKTEQLTAIHDYMVQQVKSSGGRIDAVFFSPDLKNTRSFTRKPAVGMGLKARKQFPDLNFKKSVMAGDTYSDILFGYRLGMTTVLIDGNSQTAFECSGKLDFSFPDLISLAQAIVKTP